MTFASSHWGSASRRTRENQLSGCIVMSANSDTDKPLYYPEAGLLETSMKLRPSKNAWESGS